MTIIVTHIVKTGSTQSVYQVYTHNLETYTGQRDLVITYTAAGVPERIVYSRVGVVAVGHADRKSNLSIHCTAPLSAITVCLRQTPCTPHRFAVAAALFFLFLFLLFLFFLFFFLFFFFFLFLFLFFFFLFFFFLFFFPLLFLFLLFLFLFFSSSFFFFFSLAGVRLRLCLFAPDSVHSTPRAWIERISSNQ